MTYEYVCDGSDGVQYRVAHLLDVGSVGHEERVPRKIRVPAFNRKPKDRRRKPSSEGDRCRTT